MPQQTLKFTIRQDGYVTEEVIGAASHECLNLTESIEKKLGELEILEKSNNEHNGIISQFYQNL